MKSPLVFSKLFLFICTALTMAAAPTINTQPQATTVVSRSNAVLQVEAAGNGSISYQWYQGSSGDTANPVPGFQGPLLVTLPLTASTSFWVRVTDSDGTTNSQAAGVTVNPRPALTLMGMGENTCGELGSYDGNSINPVPLVTDVVSVTAGVNYTLFITSNGTLWAMGFNYYGQLGDKTTTDRSTPVQVDTGVAQVSAGGDHTLYVKTDGTLWAMGVNYSGQLGVGIGVDESSTPLQVTTGVASVSAGGSHTLFIKTSGSLWAMGDNYCGQLGVGSTWTVRRSPTKVTSGVASVSAGYSHTLFVTTDGRLMAMGLNDYGQLGDGTTTDRYTPVDVATGVASVSAGNSNTLFVTTDGRLMAMGYNGEGLLGAHPYYVNWTTPAQVAAGVAGSDAGASHFLCLTLLPLITNQPQSAAILSGQTATLEVAAGGTGPLSYQWYEGASGDTTHPVPGATSAACTTPALTATTSYWVRVNNGTGTADSDAATVTIAVTPSIIVEPMATAVTTGDHAVLEVEADGGGLGFQWYRGNRGDTSQPVPGATGPLLLTPPMTASASFWVRVTNVAGTVDSLGASVTVNPRPSLDLMGMGDNTCGQLGDGSTLSRSIPVLADTGVTSVSAGGVHTLFITMGGILKAMGGNDTGQLGDGTTDGRQTPVEVATGVSSVSAGISHTLFVTTDSRLLAMGLNDYGQLGTGTFSYSPNPTPVEVSTGVASVSAGRKNTLFVTTGGRLLAMGQNDCGQLGIGSKDGGVHPTPAEVATGVASVSANNSHTLFVTTDGRLWGMGSNYFGQLGDGIAKYALTPTLLATDVIAVSAGHGYTLFLTADGSLWSMGWNQEGQLGDGTNTSRSTPWLVATGVTSMSAGATHSLFLKEDGTLWGMGLLTSSIHTTPVQIAAGVTDMDAGTGGITGYSMFLSLLPKITAQPAGTTIVAGREPATLHVTAQGPGTLSYQWYEGMKGDTSNPIIGATSDTYTTPVLTTTTCYWVRITNDWDSTDSVTARVTANPVPWFPKRVLTNTPDGEHPSLLWRNIPTGETAAWLMNGCSVTDAATIYNSGQSWDIEHSADFDADGRDDILWRNNDTGAHAIWLMNGLNITGSGTVYTPSANWRILACGDYDNDGCADLLWRNSADGEVVIFTMNGTGVANARTILPRGMGWTPVPVAVDLNGDGYDDILWSMDGGSDVAAWLMGPGISVASGATIYCYGPSYSLVVDALGDFNGDGMSDLLWRNATTGDTSVWLMNGLSVAGAGSIYSGDANWAPIRAADLHGDGSDGLLWRNATTGDHAFYRMGCTTTTVSVASGVIIYSYTTDWTVLHVADFDRDGMDDLVWRSTGTGAVVLWLMNGSAVVGSATLY